MAAGERAPSTQLDLNGVSIEHRWVGPRAANAIVLLHEGLGSTSAWKRFPERLAERCGESVFVYSRLGYGWSSPALLPRPVSFMHQEATEWLPRILEAAGIENAALVGHSDGASIALIYAGNEPSVTVRSLTLMAPHTFVEPVCVASIRELDSRYQADAKLRERFARHHRTPNECFRGWADVWLSPAFRDWDIRSVVPTVDVPVLVVQGEDDEYGTLEQVRVLEHSVRRRFQALILPECGHAPHRDQEKATLSAISTFLAEP